MVTDVLPLVLLRLDGLVPYQESILHFLSVLKLRMEFGEEALLVMIIMQLTEMGAKTQEH